MRFKFFRRPGLTPRPLWLNTPPKRGSAPQITAPRGHEARGGPVAPGPGAPGKRAGRAAKLRPVPEARSMTSENKPNAPTETPPEAEAAAAPPEGAAPEARAEAPAETAPSAADEVAGLQDALAAEKDRFVRLYAEFENYKKRTGRETDEFRKYANEKVLKEMLPVLDNLERAIVHVKEAPEEGVAKLLEGVELIRKQFADVLARFDVTPIPARDKPFDPQVHQAVSQQETPGVADGTVVEELQQGFFYKERVLRPAMVVVARSPKG
jgi:molecular chaperone GrpE